MKNNIFYTIFFLIIFFSCKKTALIDPTKEKVSSIKTTSNNSFTYKEVLDITKNSDYSIKHNVQKLDLGYHTLSLKIRYIEDRAYVSIENDNIKFIDWKPIKINFFYDMDFADAEKDIHLLLNDDDTSNGYVLFPAFTEQYSTYFVYYFKKNDLSYLGNYQCVDFKKGTFSFNEKSKELYISSNKILKLNKINEVNEDGFTGGDEDLKLLKEDNNNNNNNFQTITIDQYIGNKNYFIKTFDINKDGIKDKIVSHNRYQGDELLVFLGDKNNKYKFTLQTTNFSEDGGNQIFDINETKEGFQIITLFPDRGDFRKNYFVSCINNIFILKKIKSESYSWQDRYTENCVTNLNFKLNNSLEELFKTINKIQPDCTKAYDNK